MGKYLLLSIDGCIIRYAVNEVEYSGYIYQYKKVKVR
jgi:hypothetical protein